MDILITGGTGAIGRVLCRQLAASGHRLTVLSRKPDTVKAICGESATALTSLADLPAAAHFDAVFNLAGEVVIGPLWTPSRRQKLWASRVSLTEQLVDFIRRAETKPQVLISASAVGYYGNGGDKILTEGSTGNGGFAHQLCTAWETAAQQAQDFGVRVCTLRIGLVLMTHSGMLKSMLPSFRLGLGARLGDGQQWMPWIHLADLLAILQWLLNQPELSGAFNATAPNPARNAEFTQSLARHLHRPAFLCVPAVLLRRMLGEMGGLLVEGQRAVPERLVQSGFQFRHADLDSALDDLIA
jgi:uncharacterized protein (TIGR01777 family)